MQINSLGEEVVEEVIMFPTDLTEYQTKMLCLLLLEHLKLKAVMTNVTKSGQCEMELRPDATD